MSLNNIKLNSQAQRGFTIVELLIVVVVIAILAAITIVSYNGITNRANASSSKSTLGTVQKKIELFLSEESRYPISVAELTNATAQSKSYYMPTTMFGSSAPTPGDPSTTKGTTYVQLRACKSNASTLSASNVTGVRITFYEYDKATPGVTDVDLGTCSTVSPAAIVALNAT